MGRLTEILDCVSRPQGEINRELITHLDLNNPETVKQLIELRKQQKKRSLKQLTFFDE